MGDYSSYLIVLPAILIALWASMNVNSTFKKYSKIRNGRGLTGAQVARQILDANGLHNVSIEHISGDLTDHFDPKTNIVRLSDSVYNSDSVAAIGVAAHECGHAIQYKEDYMPMQIRAAIIPMTNFGSRLAVPLVIIGILLASLSQTGGTFGETIINIGLILYSLVVVFQLVTLPVEFNASGRAMKTLETQGILFGNELKGARKTLTAAALTYVAALITAIAHLLRLILIAKGGRRR